jgi:hypothetical protein
MREYYFGFSCYEILNMYSQYRQARTHSHTHTQFYPIKRLPVFRWLYIEQFWAENIIPTLAEIGTIALLPPVPWSPSNRTEEMDPFIPCVYAHRSACTIYLIYVQYIKRNWIQHVKRMPRNRLLRLLENLHTRRQKDLGKTTGEPSGWVRPERVNTWPNSVAATWWWINLDVVDEGVSSAWMFIRCNPTVNDKEATSHKRTFRRHFLDLRFLCRKSQGNL